MKSCANPEKCWWWLPWHMSTDLQILMANRHGHSAWLTCKSAFIHLSRAEALHTNDVLRAPEKIPATAKGSSRRTWDERRCAQNLLHSAIAAAPSVRRAWKESSLGVAASTDLSMPAIRDRRLLDSGETPGPAR